MRYILYERSLIYERYLLRENVTVYSRQKSKRKRKKLKWMKIRRNIKYAKYRCNKIREKMFRRKKYKVNMFIVCYKIDFHSNIPN